jgi:hypothetical protein
MTTHARPPRIGGRRAFVLGVAVVAFAPAASLACGACVEDKIAATYDHSVVEQAAANGGVMVFCEVTGRLHEQRLKQAVRRVRGVSPRSVRVSSQPPALSFSIDPRAQSPQAAVDAVHRNLEPGTRLTIVRLRPPASSALPPR